MSVPIYLACGIPWTIYALTQHAKSALPTYVVTRVLLCVAFNLVFWPLAQLIAANKEC